MNELSLYKKINVWENELEENALSALSVCTECWPQFCKTLMNLAFISRKNEQPHFLEVFPTAVSKKFRGFVVTLLVVLLPGLGACDATTKARLATDFAIANVHNFNIETLVQAETSRQRLRKARCYNPMLTPSAISSAAEEPRLGERWIDELLRDCPQFSAFIIELALRRVQAAGFLKSGSAP